MTFPSDFRTRVEPVRDHLIWSYEHSSWWRSNRCGYATDLIEAGLYTKAEADQIVADSLGEEKAVPLAQMAGKIREQIDRYRDNAERMENALARRWAGVEG